MTGEATPPVLQLVETEGYNPVIKGTIMSVGIHSRCVHTHTHTHTHTTGSVGTF